MEGCAHECWLLTSHIIRCSATKQWRYKDMAQQNNGAPQTHILNANDVRYNERWLLTSHIIVALNKLYKYIRQKLFLSLEILIEYLATQMRNLVWVAMRC